MTLKRGKSTRADGFSLVELLVVVGVIAVMVAVSIPAISRYIRNYRIRGAVQQVAGEMQRARATAVKKNVNLGVVLLVTGPPPPDGPTNYRFVVEDPTRPVAIDDAFLADPNNSAQVSGEHTLPQGVKFATTPAECPDSTRAPVAAAFNPDNFAVRFTRLGGVCVPAVGDPRCPVLNPPRTNAIMTTNAAGVVVCVREDITGISRAMLLLPSGQVVEQR